MNKFHIPVMPNEVIEYLDLQDGAAYVDCTLGLGGHTKMILEKTNGNTFVIGIDRDSNSLEIAKNNLSEHSGKVKFVNDRFSNIGSIIAQLEPSMKKKIKGVLLDLGVSTFQINDPRYSLSFNKEILNETIDMRLDPWCKNSAAEILNVWTEKQLSDLFWDYADYKKARLLAKIIVQNRPIHTLKNFVDLCSASARGFKNKSRLNPATLPLMALRIIVNDEFDEIRKGLTGITENLEPGARIVVISFNSGEDRIVKRFFKENAGLQILTKKPLLPQIEEIRANPSARSAKLRAAYKV